MRTDENRLFPQLLFENIQKTDQSWQIQTDMKGGRQVRLMQISLWCLFYTVCLSRLPISNILLSFTSVNSDKDFGLVTGQRRSCSWKLQQNFKYFISILWGLCFFLFRVPQFNYITAAFSKNK